MLRTFGVQSEGHVITGNPQALRELANQGRPVIAGVQGVRTNAAGIPTQFNHAVVIDRMVMHNGQPHYLVVDPHSEAAGRFGGRYLVPARVLEVQTTAVLDPLPQGAPARPALDPQRQAFRAITYEGMPKPVLVKMMGGAVSGAVTGAVTTYVVCMVMGNRNEDCLVAAGMGVPSAAMWGAIAASGEIGALLAAAYGAAHGALAIGQASVEFAKLVDAIIEESKQAGDIEALVRSRVPALLAAEQQSLGEMQRLLDQLGAVQTSLAQATAPLEQASSRFDVLYRRLAEARQNIAKVQTTCTANQQRVAQLGQLLGGITAVQQAQSGLQRAVGQACRTRPPQQADLRTAQAAYAQFRQSTASVERNAMTAIATRRQIENDESLITALASQVHPVADVAPADQLVSEIRRMCQTPPSGLAESRALIPHMSHSLDVIRTRADLLGKYLPTRASDIRVDILQLRQDRLAPLQTRMDSLARFWNDACGTVENRRNDLVARANALELEAASACRNRVRFPSEAQVAAQLGGFTQLKQAGERDWGALAACGASTSTASGLAPAKPPASAPIYVFVLDGIGVVMAREEVVKTRPHCEWTGGGPRPCPKAPPAKSLGVIGGPYASEEAAKADMKTRLECFNGYWGAFIKHGDRNAWLQNNVTTGDCKSVKQL